VAQDSFRVGIVGGGIAGLTLAQGLKKAGIAVSVFERDRTRSDRLQGYRVHISPAGSRALHDCLPPALFDAFVATCGRSGGAFTFFDDQLRELLRIDSPPGSDPASSHHSVSRITLRQVLLSGLDDVVQFDKIFRHYEADGDGVVAYFTDGTSARCDVLVGADGGNSRVRRQLLPHAARRDTGVRGIAGKVVLTAATRARIAPALLRGAALMMAPQRISFFLAPQEFGAARAPLEGGIADGVAQGVGGNDASRAHGVLFDNTQDYIMWAMGGRPETLGFTRPAETLGGDELQRLALGAAADWARAYRDLIRLADPATVSLLKIHTSDPVAPWPSARITVMGDAIHAMTPYKGIGANVALRDAGLLYRQLIAAQRGELPLLQAIGAYEAAMRDYGFAAVRDSLHAMEQAVGPRGWGFAIAKAGMRALNALPPVKRFVFRRLADA
jgi:2-polyprenyl-6-methoxyphenol hydroxylase-like FAD-dependent oxidoreductase